jgi:hypothetical protein
LRDETVSGLTNQRYRTDPNMRRYANEYMADLEHQGFGRTDSTLFSAPIKEAGATSATSQKQKPLFERDVREAPGMLMGSKRIPTPWSAGYSPTQKFQSGGLVKPNRVESPRMPMPAPVNSRFSPPAPSLQPAA